MAEVHPKLSRSAWESLVELSGRHLTSGSISREGDFENFIPKFIQLVKQPLPRVASQGSIEDLYQQKRHSLHILANLALHEYLRPMIMAHEGIQLFMDTLKGKYSDLKNDLGARRTATKGLMNLVMTKRDQKLMVLSQLDEEIKQV